MAPGERDTIAASAMARAWRSAASDLGIRFVSPFSITYKDAAYWCSGWLPDFGCPKGAIIAGRDTVEEIFDVADALGFYASGLSPYHYEKYDRARFVETLNDWGWFSDPADAPPWFTGGFARHGGRE